MKKIIAFLMVFSICLVCFGTYGFESADICTDEACGHDHIEHDHSGHIAFAIDDTDDGIGGDDVRAPALWATVVSQSYRKSASGDFFDIELSIGIANFDTQIASAEIEVKENNYYLTLGKPEISGNLFGMTVTSVNNTASGRNVLVRIDHPTTNSGTLMISYPVIRISRPTGTITFGGQAMASGTTIPADSQLGSFNIYVCEHTNFALTTTKQATCSSSGFAEYVCQACGMKDPNRPGRAITPTGHTFDYSKHFFDNLYGYRAATCQQMGYGCFECSVCGAIGDPTYAPIIDHIWGSRYLENGVWKQKCTMCNTVRNADNQCSHSLSAYTYLSTQTPSTCTTKGSAVYRCPTCGVTDIRELPLADHTPGEWTVVKAATCSAEGQRKSTCSVCQKVFTETIPTTSHDFSTWTTTTAATCASDGQRTRTCNICKTVQNETIEKIGHDYGTWKTVTEATCVEAGVEQRICSVCGDKITREIDVIPHSYSAWTVSLAPTCAAVGSEHRSCTVCGKSDTREIAVASDAHKYGDWRIVSAKTCTTDGAKERTCEYCAHVDRVVDSSIGHTFGNWETKGKTTSRACPCGYTEAVTKVKGGVEKTLTCLDGTLKITGATASQDVVFEVLPMSLDQENYYKQYMPFDKAYTYTVYVDGVKSAITADMTLGLTIDAGLKDYEISVVSLRGTSFFTVGSFDRKGLDLTLNGANLLGADSIFITKGAEIKPNIALPIVIAVLTLVIAGAAVYVIMSKSKSKTNMF